MNLLKKLFGKEGYCRFFHSAIGTNDGKCWYCKKCNLKYKKRYSDNFIGPK